MNAASIAKFGRRAASTCNTVGTPSTSERSTVSIMGHEGNPRSGITSALVCRTRANNDSTCGFKRPFFGIVSILERAGTRESQIPLEDNFNDVRNKAPRGLKISGE